MTYIIYNNNITCLVALFYGIMFEKHGEMLYNYVLVKFNKQTKYRKR